MEWVGDGCGDMWSPACCVVDLPSGPEFSELSQPSFHGCRVAVLGSAVPLGSRLNMWLAHALALGLSSETLVDSWKNGITHQCQLHNRIFTPAFAGLLAYNDHTA